jgi:D-alanyl-D-alanine carboxypeptidase
VLRALVWLVLTPLFVAVAVIGVRTARSPLVAPAAAPAAPYQVAQTRYPGEVAPEPRDLPPADPGVAARCGEGPAQAADANAASLTTAAWSAFGRPETGWAIYAPRAAIEIGAAGCGPGTPGFADALAVWQGSRRLPRTGVMDEPTLRALAVTWALRRPFVLVNKTGLCPAPPPPEALETSGPGEGYGRTILLRRGAMDAWRRMLAAARAAEPSIAADRNMMTLMSGYRDPAEEAARCLDGGCDNVSRSPCSAHRTGLAMDLYLGAAPGQRPDSTADDNRLFQTRGPAYRWLIANAARFGFVNYAFEPWHWEWTGEPVIWPGT